MGYRSTDEALIQLSFCTKYSRWKYEKEFRYVFDIENIGNGRIESCTIHANKLGLHVAEILIGKDCERTDELIKIGESLKCNVSKMYFNEKLKYFSLTSKRLYRHSKK